MPDHLDPDAALMLRVKQGDRDAFEALVEKYKQPVMNLVYRMLRDATEAEDLAQNVFVQVHKSAHRYQVSSKFSTWLYSITRNHCFSELKARAGRSEQASEPLLAGLIDRAPSPYTQLEQQNLAAALRDWLRSSLTEMEGRVMTLHYGEDLPLEAVTQLLNLENPSGAKAYIVSARRKLARAVERWKAGDRKF